MSTGDKIRSHPNNVTTKVGAVSTKMHGSMALGVIITPIPPTDIVVMTVTGTVTGTGGASPIPLLLP